MWKPARFVYSAMLAGALSASAQPLAAQTVQECYDYVIKTCSDAMEDSNFFERVAIGIVCSAMLAGCTAKIT